MIELVIEARRKDLDGRLEVGRVLPFARRRMVGPFIFLDHIGPAELPAGAGVNVRPHPHIGLSTVTYLFAGEIHHHDSLGSSQLIRPGEVNWMTAGRGIVHSERPPAEREAMGGPMHGVQAWVALPLEAEETAPAFDHYGQGALPTFESGGVWGRLIAGEAFGEKAAVKTHSPLFYLHWELQPGAKTVPPEGHEERAIYVAVGAVEIAGREYRAGQMVVFTPEGRPTITALQKSIVLCLGGAPVGPRLIWWNLVASTQDRIDRAKADWAAGRMPLPLDDNQERIELPEKPKPPEPAS